VACCQRAVVGRDGTGFERLTPPSGVCHRSGLIVVPTQTGRYGAGCDCDDSDAGTHPNVVLADTFGSRPGMCLGPRAFATGNSATASQEGGEPQLNPDPGHPELFMPYNTLWAKVTPASAGTLYVRGGAVASTPCAVQLQWTVQTVPRAQAVESTCMLKLWSQCVESVWTPKWAGLPLTHRGTLVRSLSLLHSSRWCPPPSDLQVTTQGSVSSTFVPMDTTLAVYTGSAVGSLTLVASNNNCAFCLARCMRCVLEGCFPWGP
jgi:hypothetical protein